jgi:hypothetical protein
MKFRFNGKENIFSIGTYPETSLAQARRIRDEARLKLKDGINPNEAKKQKKQQAAENTLFKALAMEWMEDRKAVIKENTYLRDLSVFEKDLFPDLGNMPIDQIKGKDVLAGAFMLIRKEALDKAGLLDEDFFMYGEDIDLSYRLKLAGYKNYYMPERILHYKGESTSKGNIKYVKIFYGAMLIFYRKHYSGAGKLFSLLIRLAVWFRALLDLMFHASANKKTKSSRRRLLILSSEMSLETVRTACLKQIPNLEFVNHWNLDEHRVMDCINRSNRMKGFTDIAFCYNDVRFEQLLLLMDKMPDKHITYHIYNKKSGVLVSPGKK